MTGDDIILSLSTARRAILVSIITTAVLFTFYLIYIFYENYTKITSILEYDLIPETVIAIIIVLIILVFAGIFAYFAESLIESILRT